MGNEKYINRAEAMRYLMLGETLPEGRITELLAGCENELIQAAKPRFVSREFEITDCPIDISGDEVKAHLSGCKKVLLFAATLGNEPDRLVRAYQINDITKAVIFNACADAFIESFCEEGRFCTCNCIRRTVSDMALRRRIRRSAAPRSRKNFLTV